MAWLLLIHIQKTRRTYLLKDKAHISSWFSLPLHWHWIGPSCIMAQKRAFLSPHLTYWTQLQLLCLIPGSDWPISVLLKTIPGITQSHSSSTSAILKLQAAGFDETLVTIAHNTQYYNPKDHNINSHHCENLNSPKEQ
jgi:hypothetical protein